MIPWYLNWRVWLLAALVTVVGVSYWRGGSEPREEVGELKTEAKATAKSNEISRSTQQRIESEGYETQRRAKADDEALRTGADPDGDGGMSVVNKAYDEAVRASCRVRRASSCTGAAAAREHD